MFQIIFRRFSIRFDLFEPNDVVDDRCDETIDLRRSSVIIKTVIDETRFENRFNNLVRRRSGLRAPRVDTGYHGKGTNGGRALASVGRNERITRAADDTSARSIGDGLLSHSLAPRYNEV